MNCPTSAAIKYLINARILSGSVKLLLSPGGPNGVPENGQMAGIDLDFALISLSNFSNASLRVIVIMCNLNPII